MLIRIIETDRNNHIINSVSQIITHRRKCERVNNARSNIGVAVCAHLG